MKCKALILGVVNRSSKPGAEKAYNFNLVNFVDTENPSGGSMEMSLGKDDDPTFFAENRMKVADIHVFQNGKYTNFGGFVQKGA